MEVLSFIRSSSSSSPEVHLLIQQPLWPHRWRNSSPRHPTLRRGREGQDSQLGAFVTSVVASLLSPCLGLDTFRSHRISPSTQAAQFNKNHRHSQRNLTHRTQKPQPDVTGATNRFH